MFVQSPPSFPNFINEELGNKIFKTVQDTVDINITTTCKRISSEKVDWSVNVESKTQKIQKVIYHLHSSFNPNRVEVSNSPFQIVRSGWGSFELKIQIEFEQNDNLMETSYTVGHMLDFNISKSVKLVKLAVRRPLMCSEYLLLEIGSRWEKFDDSFKYTVFINPKTNKKPNNAKITFPKNLNIMETFKDFPVAFDNIGDGVPFEISIKINVLTHMKTLNIVHTVSFDKSQSSSLYFLPLPNKLEVSLCDLNFKFNKNRHNEINSVNLFIENAFDNDNKGDFNQAIIYYGLMMKQKIPMPLHITSKAKNMALKSYVVRNKELFKIESWIEKNWINYIMGKESFEEIQSKITKQSPGVVATKFFTEKFCNSLIQEMDNLKEEIPFCDLNRKGINLLEIGFKGFFDKLQYFVTKLCKTQHPCLKFMECKQAYVIKYDPKEEHSHEIHVDESDLTLNLCLGKNFEGGALKTVPKEFDEPNNKFPSKKEKYLEEFLTNEEREKGDNVYIHPQIPGNLLFHSGALSHFTDPITSGNRYNLIIWFNATFELGKLIDTLPLDITTLIFSFLQIKDIRNVSLSCKKYSQITKSEKLWRLIFNKKFDSKTKELLTEEEQKKTFLEKCKILNNPQFCWSRPIENNQPHFPNPYYMMRMPYNPPPMRMPYNHNPMMRHAPPPMNPKMMRMPYHHQPMMRHVPMRMPYDHNPMMRHVPVKVHNPMTRQMPPPMRVPHNYNLRQMHPNVRPSPNVNQYPYSPSMKTVENPKQSICWIF